MNTKVKETKKKDVLAKTQTEKKAVRKSKRVLELEKGLEEVRAIFRKHNVKPFDRREFYASQS